MVTQGLALIIVGVGVANNVMSGALLCDKCVPQIRVWHYSMVGVWQFSMAGVGLFGSKGCGIAQRWVLNW